PQRARREEHGAHARPVRAAGGEEEAGERDGDPGGQTERVAQTVPPWPLGPARIIACAPAGRKHRPPPPARAPTGPRSRRPRRTRAARWPAPATRWRAGARTRA